MTSWIEIYTAANMLEASFVKGRLEADAIPAILKYESAGRLYGITVDGLSEVRIFVPEELQQEAIEILQEIEHRQD